MKCPKCGSKMQQWTNDPLVGTIGEWVCPVCHHSEPIFECGHEEKVGGEKCPKCGSEMTPMRYVVGFGYRYQSYECRNCGYESKLGGEKG